MQTECLDQAAIPTTSPSDALLSERMLAPRCCSLGNALFPKPVHKNRIKSNPNLCGIRLTIQHQQFNRFMDNSPFEIPVTVAKEQQSATVRRVLQGTYRLRAGEVIRPLVEDMPGSWA